MQTPRARRLTGTGAAVVPRARRLTLTGAAVLLTLVIAGCGRSGQAIDAGAAPVVPASAASGPIAALATPTPTELAAATPAATPTPGPTATPVPTPDFPAIEALISGINADLGADATADTDEGSPQ